ncbi:glycerate kinase [Corynebacterium mendelii]|uniref:Glycerate kinase n=1 Tax=Corynebacterium mendelii TaxID=2765362 RepID=A0A939E0C1_9CORY|nr:glycerate kinase [Corynebacterium mendelii]MBN9643142.1 glycerate kinase [Corynebacterium mendelii]
MAHAAQPTFVIAPDRFAAVSTHRAGEALAEGVDKVYPEAKVTVIPMAAGCAGTAGCFSGEPVTVQTTTAAGTLTEAAYVYDDGASSGFPQAFIDVAAANGTAGVDTAETCLTGDTYGTGVLIADAVSRGARRITISTGGAATLDGGTGIATALGAVPVDRKGASLDPGAIHLAEIDRFDVTQLNAGAAGVEFMLLTDDQLPLCGDDGAAVRLGGALGATAHQQREIDAGLKQLARVCGVDPSAAATGAGGGIAVSLTWLSELVHGQPRVHSGKAAWVVAAATGLKEHIADADMVITAEHTVGMDSFTHGVTGAVAGLARGAGVPVTVAAAHTSIDLPGGLYPVTVADTGNPDDLRSRLVEAGAAAARHYRDTH